MLVTVLVTVLTILITCIHLLFQKMSPTWKFSHSHLQLDNKFKSSTSRCHQHNCHQKSTKIRNLSPIPSNRHHHPSPIYHLLLFENSICSALNWSRSAFFRPGTWISVDNNFVVGQFLFLMKFPAAKNRVLDFFEKIEKYFSRPHF